MNIYTCRCGNQYRTRKAALNCDHIKVRKVKRGPIQTLFNLIPKTTIKRTHHIFLPFTDV